MPDQEDPLGILGDSTKTKDPLGILAPVEKKKIGGVGSKIGGQAGTFAAPSVEGKAPFSAAAAKIGVPNTQYPTQSIEDYNKWFDDLTGHKEFSLGSDLPQIKKATAEKEYETKRDIVENELSPVSASIQAGTVTPQKLKELHSKPYGKNYVESLITQEIPEADVRGLSTPLLQDVQFEKLAADLQAKNRAAGVAAQNQVEFQLDNELANAFKTFKYGSTSEGGGYDPTSERNSGEPTKSEFSFGEVNTTSVPELYAALKKTAKQHKIWDAEGNEVDKREFLKKIQQRMFQVKSQDPLAQELVDMSDKIRAAVEKVPVEWKKKFGANPTLVDKDAEYVKLGLNFLADTEPGEYKAILGVIETEGQISEQQYNQLVTLGRDMKSYKDFKSGERMEDDDRNFLTPQLKTSGLAGWLSEELKRKRKSVNRFYVKDKDIVEAFKDAPEELKDEDALNMIRLKEAVGDGIVGSGVISKTFRDIAQPFESIINSANVSIKSPFKAYLDSKNLVGGGQILIPQKGGGYGTELKSETILNKAIGGFFQMLTQAAIARGLGVVGKGVVNPFIAKVDPRAMMTTSQAALSFGTPASILAQTYGGEYIDFLEKTGDPNKAALGALTSSLAQGWIEKVVLPDVKLAEDIVGGLRRNFAKEIINVIEKGGGKAKVADVVKDFAANVTKTLGKEALVEEVSQNMVNYLTEQIISPNTAVDRNIVKESEDIAADALVSMSISSLIGGGAQTNVQRQLSKSQLNYIGVNSQKFLESLNRQFQKGEIKQAEYDLAKNIVIRHGESVANAPKRDSKHELISANRQLEYAYQNTVAEINTELAARQKDKILQEPFLKKVEEADKIKRQIFYGEESEQLPPKENEPIVIDQDRDLMDEEESEFTSRPKEQVVADVPKAAEGITNEGVKEAFLTNPEIGLAEVAQQLHSTTGEAETASKVYGNQIADLALELYPTMEDATKALDAAKAPQSGVSVIRPEENVPPNVVPLVTTEAPPQEPAKTTVSDAEALPVGDVAGKTWYRGVNKNNQEQGDRFYSDDESTAGDYAINKVGEEPTMTKLSKDELPQNPLIAGTKEDLAETIGFPEENIYDLEGDFDKKAKEYAQSKGHDAIVYESGSMGNSEMHVFEKKSDVSSGVDAAKPPEPPAEPPQATPKAEGSGKMKDKGILNRLYNAKNTPQAAKEGFEREGLQYETKSQEEAAGVAKAVVESEGIDEAVKLAAAGTFDGDVNSLIFAESLNQLAEQEAAATDPKAKFDLAEKFAEISIQYDKAARTQGRFNAAINYFYKHSPLGVVLKEQADRKENFDNWAGAKDKTWKDFFEEMKKQPEFEEIVRQRVFEQLKTERATSRKKRIEKVRNIFKQAKEKVRNNKGATYAMVIPPHIMEAVLEAMELAYEAGEAVASIIQKGVDEITKKLGHSNWDSATFRNEWEDKLKDTSKAPPTVEELKQRLLDKFRKKLKGLNEKQKEQVVRKAFEKLVDAGALDYDEFRQIIASVVGYGELTEEDAARLKTLVEKQNAVGEAAKKVQEERTDESMVKYRAAELEAGKAARELQELLWNKPDILKRITSIMQLSTLGPAALINNPIYNFFNQLGVRFPVGLVNDIMDRMAAGIGQMVGKEYQREYNILETQGEFWSKLGFGSKESFIQLFTGLNRQDYIQKEYYGQQIRPMRALKALIDNASGKKKLTTRQVWDKALQASVGIPAEAVARVLNLGDKPQRFAAEGSQASAFAKALGLKDMGYKIFIEFPREEAYRAYKEQGLSDDEAGKKADYIKEAIIQEGKRSTFQQDNIINNVITAAAAMIPGGGKDSGVANLAKTLTISPYIKIPTNAFWSMYNLVNPEMAVLQAVVHGGRSKWLRNKKDKEVAARLQMREARYWMAHAVVGMAIRGVIIMLVKEGIFVPGNSGEESKKEREAEQFFSLPGSVNVTKLWALISGKDPKKIENGVLVSNRWFGQFGAIGNIVANKWEDATPEQREAQDEFWNIALGGMELEALSELQNGIFANSSSLLQSLGSGDFSRYGLNSLNLLANVIQPATFAQINRAALNEVPQVKGDTFLEKLNQNFAQRSTIYRRLFDVQVKSKQSIWGEPIPRGGNILSRMFGISKMDDKKAGRKLYDDYLRTNNREFLPPDVPKRLNDKELTTKQHEDLSRYINQSRKAIVLPYVNDEAEIPVLGKKYSELPNDETKTSVLGYLYGVGRENGLQQFYTDYPELMKGTKSIDEQVTNKLLDAAKQIMKIRAQQKQSE